MIRLNSESGTNVIEQPFKLPKTQLVPASDFIYIFAASAIVLSWETSLGQSLLLTKSFVLPPRAGTACE